VRQSVFAGVRGRCFAAFLREFVEMMAGEVWTLGRAEM
jgi:hypothetical protein